MTFLKFVFDNFLYFYTNLFENMFKLFTWLTSLKYVLSNYFSSVVNKEHEKNLSQIYNINNNKN